MGSLCSEDHIVMVTYRLKIFHDLYMLDLITSLHQRLADIFKMSEHLCGCAFQIWPIWNSENGFAQIDLLIPIFIYKTHSIFYTSNTGRERPYMIKPRRKWN